MNLKFIKNHLFIDNNEEDKDIYKNVVIVSLISGKSLLVKKGLYDLLKNNDFDQIPKSLMVKLINKEFLLPEEIIEHQFIINRTNSLDELTIVIKDYNDLLNINISKINTLISQYNFTKIELIFKSEISLDAKNSFKNQLLEIVNKVTFSRYVFSKEKLSNESNNLYEKVYRIISYEDYIKSENNFKNEKIFLLIPKGKLLNTSNFSLFNKNIKPLVNKNSEIFFKEQFLLSFNLRAYSYSLIGSNLDYIKNLKNNSLIVDNSFFSQETKLKEVCSNCNFLGTCGGYLSNVEDFHCPDYKYSINNYYNKILNERSN
jgi:hypothetical protein